MTEPWKFTMSPSRAVSARIVSYQRYRSFDSDSMKSTLIPATPQDRHSASFRRASGLFRSRQIVHRCTWMPRLLA
jgi:hypothetical protein